MSNARFLAVQALFLVVAGSLVATGSESAGAGSMTGCLTAEGTLTKLAPGRRPLQPCSADESLIAVGAGDISAVRTSVRGGLQGGVRSGAARVKLQKAFKLPQNCSPTQLPRWNGTSWECGDVGSITAGLGLEGGETEGTVALGLQPGFALPQDCAQAAIIRWDGDKWACGEDQDTNSGGDISAVAAANGLSGGGDSGPVTLSIGDTFRLPQGCQSQDIVAWSGAGWTCATDADSGGDVTGVAAGAGLTGGGNTGDLTLQIGDSFQLPQNCTGNEIPVWNGTSWACGADQNAGGDITEVETLVAGGLDGGATSGAASLGLQSGYKLPQACALGQLPKSTAAGWECANDANTTYDGTDFALSDQTCIFFSQIFPYTLEFMTGIGENGVRQCGNINLGAMLEAAELVVAYNVSPTYNIPEGAATVGFAACSSDEWELIGGGAVQATGAADFIVAMESTRQGDFWKAGLWNHDNQGSITAATYAICAQIAFPSLDPPIP